MLRSSAFIVFTLLYTANLSLAEPVKVSVFYESLCPDSIRFIINQLQPSYEVLANYITLDFVPYGKAIHNLVDGKWQFECQHGSRECHGNKLQACGLNQNATQEENLNFVACVMGKSDPSLDSNVQTCAEATKGISWDKIKTCYDDGTADKLLAAFGDRTHELQPNIAFVPTIVYNNVFDQNKQDDSLSAFLYTACTEIKGDKPSGCPSKKPNTYNSYRNRWSFF